MKSIVVSLHAIDQASNRLNRQWKRTRRDDEGLATWLRRMAQDAHNAGSVINGKTKYRGIKFAFVSHEFDEGSVVLATVMRDESIHKIKKPPRTYDRKQNH